ncbi:hypothetical protein JYQ62_10945 [Nostoc sp. UHCC 0702]|nr:hypothetical protein JYQ62_10945 [Nostoc sp. UHCC 0702]
MPSGSAWFNARYYVRQLRGGSFESEPFTCRASYRINLGQDARNKDLGFRVVAVVA